MKGRNAFRSLAVLTGCCSKNEDLSVWESHVNGGTGSRGLTKLQLSDSHRGAIVHFITC